MLPLRGKLSRNLHTKTLSVKAIVIVLTNETLLSTFMVSLLFALFPRIFDFIRFPLSTRSFSDFR